MHRRFKTCPFCGQQLEQSHSQDLSRPVLPSATAFAAPQHINTNGPPTVWAAPRSLILTPKHNQSIGLISKALEKSRRGFVEWVAGILVEFTFRRGRYLKQTLHSEHGIFVEAIDIDEDTVLRALGYYIEENFGLNEKASTDCKWVSDWWNRCKAPVAMRTPQRRHYERFLYIDLALRTPRYWE